MDKLTPSDKVEKEKFAGVAKNARFVKPSRCIKDGLQFECPQQWRI